MMLRAILKYSLLLIVIVVAILAYMAQSPFPKGIVRVALDAHMDPQSRPMTDYWKESRYFAWRTNRGALFLGRRNADELFQAVQLGDALNHNQQPILHVIRKGKHQGKVVVVHHDAQNRLLVQRTHHADNTRSWTPPKQIGDEQVKGMTLLETPDGELILIYQQQLANMIQIRMRFSHNGGLQWGSATLLSSSGGDKAEELLVDGAPVEGGYRIDLLKLQPQTSNFSLQLLQGHIANGSRSWAPIDNPTLQKTMASLPHGTYTLHDLRSATDGVRMLWRDEETGKGQWLRWGPLGIEQRDLGGVSPAPCGMSLTRKNHEVIVVREPNKQLQQISIKEQTPKIQHQSPDALNPVCQVRALLTGQDLDLLFTRQGGPNRPSGLLGLSWATLTEP
ncbi:hypothetical protein [Magnetococcus sp. PR-3]|uniref:hypothetical protein n=1 Tax=Magnetococcus sp. PR-3 TaxID=3120355 RepID=UPI002FCE3487